jgi:hypothetical protein
MLKKDKRFKKAVLTSKKAHLIIVTIINMKTEAITRAFPPKGLENKHEMLFRG